MKIQLDGGVEMSLEFMIIKYAPNGEKKQRAVRVDRQDRAFTNTLFFVETGNHKFDLGTRNKNYKPAEYELPVTDTSILDPLILEFTAK